MISQEVRRNFLKYFQSKGHTLIPSSPVVPHEDPTLLFTNAGMNQFKDVFLGKSQRDYTKAATSQKCIRVGGKHNDLDNVGHTSRHLTFFEMLGNFSFGDYFKEQAILYAWEVSTQVFGFDPERIWVSVFEKDEEAYSLWSKILPEKRIVLLGEKDNFWAMGDTGPCGPCAELLYDRGSSWGKASSPKEDTSGERFLEFWNLVFMQFNRSSQGELTPLPKKSIDTGAGLERVISLRMGVDNVFATDIFQSLIQEIAHLSGVSYEEKKREIAPAFHVIADHLRSLCFAMADGAQPSNLDRGYVLRKLLRRAVRYGKILGFQKPFLARLVPKLVQLMGGDYKELIQAQSRIQEILTQEEEAFLRTLKRGGNILSAIIEKAKHSPQREITGEEAFKLKDTYGLPLEEILLLAKDSALNVNLETFGLLEEEAKEKSRASKQANDQQAEENLYQKLLERLGASQFVGYDKTEEEASVLAILQQGAEIETLHEEQEALLILDKTPFYAEKGGQMADTGIIEHHKAHFQVTSCSSPYPGLIVHQGKLLKGILFKGEPIKAHIDVNRRNHIAAHHTATHLLHWALQQVLGSHIRQAGSLVTSDRLRFDFSHHKPLSFEEIRKIEQLINDKIRRNTSVHCYELSYEEAQKKEDIKQFFGDKYGSRVRVVDIDYSKELCGGTHVSHVGSLGLFRILKESSIAAGIRRIEAVCGLAAEEAMHKEADLIRYIALTLKTPEELIQERITYLIEENKALEEEVKNYKRASIKTLAHTLFQEHPLKKGTFILVQKIDRDAELIPLLFEELQKKSSSFALVLGYVDKGRVSIAMRVSSDLIAKGIQAHSLIKEIASFIDGSGGGKEASAQAGGKNPAGLDLALTEAEKGILAKL